MSENREAALQLPDKYAQAIAASNVVEDDRQVADAVAKIPADHYQENNNKEVYRFPFSSIDPHHPSRAPTRPRACSPLHRGL